MFSPLQSIPSRQLRIHSIVHKKIENTYIDDNIDTEVRHVADDASLLRGDLGVLDQLGQVLLGNAILGLDVQQDDPGKQTDFNLETFFKKGPLLT